MTYFQNAVCPVCQQPFTEHDDVVVCPECGAPYHRLCYKEAGRCLFTDKHGTGFSYLPEPETIRQHEPERFVLCPRCGKSNPLGARACGNCGTPLPTADAPTGPAQPDPTPAYRRSRENATPDTEKFRPAGQIRFGFSLDEEDEDLDATDELQAQLDAAHIKSDETIDGFTLREWLSYLGPSAPIYLFQFKQMDRSRRGLTFSLSAALFAPIYFAYRKMWSWSVVALLAKLLCMLPGLVLGLQNFGLLTALPFSTDQLAQYSLYLSYLDTALNVFWGISSYTFYRRHSVRTIGQVKQSSGGGEAVYQLLSRAGGVSVIGAAVLGAILMTASSLFYLSLY